MYRNEWTTQFWEVLNIYPAFCLYYQNIKEIMYYMVKDMHFSLHDILNNLAYYECLDLIDMYAEEVEKKNKQQEEEHAKMEADMSKMKQNMNFNNNNNFKPPAMPAMPKF